MSYIVIKTIGGHQYRYLQTSYRVGKKVKTKSVYLGPVGGGGFLTPIPPHERGLKYIGKLMEKYPTTPDKTNEQIIAKVQEKFTAATGLSLPLSSAPAPVEKTSSTEASKGEGTAPSSPDADK